MVTALVTDADVALLSGDGVRLSASRAVLCRSDVFSRMLASSCVEGQAGTITIGEAMGHDLQYVISALVLGPESQDPLVLPSRTDSLAQLAELGATYSIG